MFIALLVVLGLCFVLLLSCPLAAYAALEPEKTDLLVGSLLVGLLILIIFIWFSSPAQAASSCYKNAETPAHAFFAMDQAGREKINSFIGLSEDGSQCREVLILDGELAETGTVFIPFGQLYKLYLEAISQRDKKKIKFLFENVKPTMKSIDSFLKLPFLVPPDGWGPAKQLAKIFEVDELTLLNSLGEKTEDRIPTPDRFILGALFQAWGGMVQPDCTEHYVAYQDKTQRQTMNMIFNEKMGYNISLTMATFFYVYSGLEPNSLFDTGASHDPIILRNCKF